MLPKLKRNTENNMASRKNSLFRWVYPAGVTPLPSVVCLVVFVGHVLNSSTVTMPFSFLPKMIQTFGFAEVDIGYYTGWVATSIFICNIFASFVWGILVDRYGPKCCCITSSLCAAVTTIVFGLSYNYNWAFWSRFSQGISVGWSVAAKAILFDLTDNTNQSYAMAIISTAYALGMIIGPAIGGYLAMPCEKYPSVFPKGSLFDEFKFLLPNLIIAVATVVVSVLMIFLVPDTRSGRATCSGRRGGLSSKDPQSGLVSEPSDSLQGAVDDLSDSDRVPLLPIQESLIKTSAVDQESVASGVMKKRWDFFRWCPLRERASWGSAALNKDLWMSCMLYVFFMLISTGFMEIFSIWALTSKYYHGLGFSTSETGTQLLVFAVFLAIIFPVLSTRVIRVWGAKKVMVWCSLLQVLTFPAIASTWLISDRFLQMFVLNILLIVSQTPDYLCFSSINIFLNNSVSSDLVGFANGLGLTASSIGRAIAPALFGGLFSWSLMNIDDIYPDGLGYPFDQNFTFLLLSLTWVICAVWGSYFPDYLDFKREWPNEDILE